MKVFLTTCLVILFATAASAQNTAIEINANNYEQMAQKEATWLTALLSLSELQSDSISKINKNYYYKMADLRGQQLSLSERGQRLQQFLIERNARFQNNMSTEQYNQFREQNDRMKRRSDSLRAAHSQH